MNLSLIETPAGLLGIAEADGAVTNLWFETDRLPDIRPAPPTPAISRAAAELLAYFAGELREFTVPLAPRGTPYMTRIWELLRRVPYGGTATYGEIAALSGNPKAARAVGLANNRNPVPLFIPCHRIVGSGGKLTGYRGGLELKRRLLGLEKGNATLPLRKG